MYTTKNLLDLSHSICGEYLEKYEYPWEALPNIKHMIKDLQGKLDKEEYNEVKEGVFVHKTATVAPTAYLVGPASHFHHNRARCQDRDPSLCLRPGKRRYR